MILWLLLFNLPAVSHILVIDIYADYGGSSDILLVSLEQHLHLVVMVINSVKKSYFKLNLIWDLYLCAITEIELLKLCINKVRMHISVYLNLPIKLFVWES